MKTVKVTKEDKLETLLTPKDVASILGVHIATVRREVHRGNLKAFILGRHIRVKPEILAEYVNRNSTDSVVTQ
jgi:excisionase family DNA binding protein